MKKIFFITGTDTHVGKTTVAVSLLHQAKMQGLRCVGLKPIATGAVFLNGRLLNEDAMQLKQASTLQLKDEEVNPFVYVPAIAPHLAARAVGENLTVAKLVEKVKPLLTLDVDYILIEGAGGLMVPLNEEETFADLIKALDVPVILVCGMRLGVLNHALLTAKMIENKNLNFAGWIANCIEPDFPYLQENLTTLQCLIQSPYLGLTPYQLVSACPVI